LRDFNYGGQAVFEGVMMRGRHVVALAVRRPSGEIAVHTEPLAGLLYTSRWMTLPFLRGSVRLWDALILGTRMLMLSANLALDQDEEGRELTGPFAWGTLALSLGLGVTIFLLVPAFLVSLFDGYVSSSLLSNALEGAIRLGILVGYLGLVGLLPDIKRVFAYHGAEHKTINAYEDGALLEPEVVRAYSSVHSRCGTSFLLVIVVLTVLIFALLGRPPLLLRLVSRILLLPLIAGISYELIRFSAAHRTNPLIRLFLVPNLALQRLSTGEPDESMLEVAITALKQVLAGEGSL